MSPDLKPTKTPYGFVKRQGRELIPVLIDKFASNEFNNQRLVAPQQLEARLNQLVDGRRVPIPIMNCIDFDWQPSPGEYPKSIIKPDVDTSIAVYFKPKTEEILTDLRALGDPNPSVIVPDSEIFDTRVFSFKQTLEERQSIANNIEACLAERLGELPGSSNPVIRWSRYCEVNGLALPTEYTTRAADKIDKSPDLTKKATKQIKDSERYLMQHGIQKADIVDIPQAEVATRIKWYLAMYTGEGITLAQQEALMLNFEDGRVPAWYRRGADDQLPILTQASPNEFYTWRRQVKAGNPV